MLVKIPRITGSDDHYDRRVPQFRAGRPRGLLELSDHLAKEDARAAERVFHLGFLKMAGAEGLEPPTDGFGDRYSTN